MSATQEHSEALKPSKHGLRASSDTRTCGLGAGRSLVRIQSPRLQEKQVIEPKTAVSSSRKKGPPRGTISRTTCKHGDLPATLAGGKPGVAMALLKSPKSRQRRLAPVACRRGTGTLCRSRAGHVQVTANARTRTGGRWRPCRHRRSAYAAGDELPEHLRTREGQRAALREAKQKLARERAGREDAKVEAADAESQGVKLVLDPEVIVARMQGRGVGARGAPPAR